MKVERRNPSNEYPKLMIHKEGNSIVLAHRIIPNTNRLEATLLWVDPNLPNEDWGDDLFKTDSNYYASSFTIYNGTVALSND